MSAEGAWYPPSVFRGAEFMHAGLIGMVLSGTPGPLSGARILTQSGHDERGAARLIFVVTRGQVGDDGEQITARKVIGAMRYTDGAMFPATEVIGDMRDQILDVV